MIAAGILELWETWLVMFILLRDPCDGGDSCCRRDNVCKEGQFTPPFQTSPVCSTQERCIAQEKETVTAILTVRATWSVARITAEGETPTRLFEQFSETLMRFPRHTANQSLLQVGLRLNRRLLPQPTAALGRALRGRRLLLHLGQAMLWRLRERPSYWTRINPFGVHRRRGLWWGFRVSW